MLPPRPHQLRQHLACLLHDVALLNALANELEVAPYTSKGSSPVNVSKSSSDEVPKTSSRVDMRDASSSSCSSSSLAAVEERRSDLQSSEPLALEAATSLQQSIESHLAPLVALLQGTLPWEEAAALNRMSERRLKTIRNRRWRRRRRQRTADALRKERERYDQADQEADEWRAREIAKDIARRKIEKMKNVAKQKAKEERQKLEEELELVLMVEKLQELRSLRIQRLKKQGCFFPEEDNRFVERVRAAVEEEERQAAAAADTSAAAAAIANAEEAGKAVVPMRVCTELQKSDIQNENLMDGFGEQLLSSKGQRDLVIAPTGQGRKENESTNITKHSLVQDGLPSEFYHYYHGSSADMGTLIEVRRTWDTFILPGGSRIPGHWLDPPPPADAVWASCLVNSDELDGLQQAGKIPKK